MSDPDTMDTSDNGNKPLADSSTAAPLAAPSPPQAGTVSAAATAGTTAAAAAAAVVKMETTTTAATTGVKMETTTAAAAAAAATTNTETKPTEPIVRHSLAGAWILDKSRGEWSMRGYLETLNVPELAIQANEKGETELDTVQTIELFDDGVRITKQSRVNNNLVVELKYGVEAVELLKPDDRPKKQLATMIPVPVPVVSEDSSSNSNSNPSGCRHLVITSSLLTVNGMAHVTDTKRLVQEAASASSVLVQELTITNPESNKTHTTTRYFNPHTPTPTPTHTDPLQLQLADSHAHAHAVAPRPNTAAEDEKSGGLGDAMAAAAEAGADVGDTVVKMETEE